jgi:hypothetical protein
MWTDYFFKDRSRSAISVISASDVGNSRTIE